MKRQSWTSTDIAFFVIVTLPILGLAGLFAASAIAWHDQRAKLDATIAELVGQTGIEPDATLDFATIARIYDGRTSQEHSSTWKKILWASESLNDQYGGPFAWSNDDQTYDDVVPPGQDWPVAEIMSNYAKDAQPILAEIESLLDSDDTIWLPIVFSAMDTNLSEVQQFRSVARVLHYSLLSAIHESDHEQAMTIIRANDRLFGDAYEPSLLIDELVRIACYSMIQTDVRRSLAAGVWNAEELLALEPLVATRMDWDRRWKMTMESEMLSVLPKLTAIHGVWLAPSVLNRSIRIQSEMASFGAGSKEHVEQMARFGNEQLDSTANTRHVPIDRWLQATTMGSDWIHSLTPAFEAVARAYQRTANEQRFTQTVFALRKYRAEFKKWPDSLAQLSHVNLPASESQAFDGGPFQYVAEGENVVLYDQANEKVKYTDIGRDANKIVLIAN